MEKQEIKKKIKEAIEKNPHKEDIKKVSLFGSYAKGNNRRDSDIDVLVEFTPSAKVGFFKFVQIQRDLSDFVKKDVDLLTPEALSIFFRDKVLNEAEIIYERK